jgi:hypothetical protein
MLEKLTEAKILVRVGMGVDTVDLRFKIREFLLIIPLIQQIETDRRYRDRVICLSSNVIE